MPDKPSMNKHRPPGRPTKRTKAILGRLLEALEEGLTQRSACIAVGVSVSTLRDWRNEDPTIGDLMEAAREKARRQAMLIIKSAALSGDWRAASEFLKLTFPNDYRNTARIDVTATAQFSGVVLGEEERLELIRRRQEMLANQRPDLGRAKAVEVQQPPVQSSLVRGAVEARKLAAVERFFREEE